MLHTDTPNMSHTDVFWIIFYKTRAEIEADLLDGDVSDWSDDDTDDDTDNKNKVVVKM